MKNIMFYEKSCTTKAEQYSMPLAKYLNSNGTIYFFVYRSFHYFDDLQVPRWFNVPNGVELSSSASFFVQGGQRM